MTDCPDIILLAQYNQWMNDKLYQAAARLPGQQVFDAKGAYFGSVFATLNHILVGDTIWLKRFAEHPAGFPALASLQSTALPATLTEPLADNLAALQAQRQSLDSVILQWASELKPVDLEHTLRYSNSQGSNARRFSSLVQHFFNHQTHHRAQAGTLLHQAGIDIGPTDLVMLAPNQA